MSTINNNKKEYEMYTNPDTPNKPNPYINNHIELHSGRKFYFLHDGVADHSDGIGALMDPEEYIEDIAWALSNICRFAGHCRSFYSVAQHSVLVSRIVPEEHKLTALLHDASEAFLHDISSPLKAILQDYRSIESMLAGHLAAIFDTSFPLPACIKGADMIMLATEKRDLMNKNSKWAILEGVPTLDEVVVPLPPIAAHAIFMSEYNKLRGV